MKSRARSDRPSDGRPPSGRAARTGTRARFTSPVVLIVDDVEDNRDLFAIVLEGLGYAIEQAVDGVDALERARVLRPNVILMDLAMPNMNGFEATRAIRAVPELASTYIIAISAFTDASSAEEALAAGCDELLAKPCPPELLTARVDAGVRRGRQRDVG